MVWVPGEKTKCYDREYPARPIGTRATEVGGSEVGGRDGEGNKKNDEPWNVRGMGSVAGQFEVVIMLVGHFTRVRISITASSNQIFPSLAPSCPERLDGGLSRKTRAPVDRDSQQMQMDENHVGITIRTRGAKRVRGVVLLQSGFVGRVKPSKVGRGQKA